MPEVIDLSQAITDGLVTYRGATPVRTGTTLSREDSRAHYAEGTEFQIDHFELDGPTGTYMDAPFHRFAQGVDLAGLDLSRLVDLPGVTIRAAGKGRAVGPEAFEGIEIQGRAVLVHTGWSSRFGRPEYFDRPPFLTREAAALLLERQAAVVGLDSMNVDDTSDPARPVHTLLLGAGIPVIENMTGLDRLPDAGFRFFAPPIRMVRGGSFPVRAFALVKP